MWSSLLAPMLLVCWSIYSFLPFQPLKHISFLYRSKGCVIFFWSPLTSPLSWTKEQIKMSRVLSAPLLLHHAMCYDREASRALSARKVQSSCRKSSLQTAWRSPRYLSWPHLAGKAPKVSKRKIPWLIYSFSLKHNAPRCASPAQGTLGKWQYIGQNSPLLQF